MRQLALGSLAAGLAMWVARFIFWGPLLGWIPFTATTDANTATLQQAFKATLAPTGTGVYQVPSPATTIGTQLHAQGPVAIVHFTNSGFAEVDSTGMLWGLFLAVGCAMAMMLALRSVATNMGFTARIKLVVFVAAAIAGYSDIAPPVFNHAPWGYWIYVFVSDVVTWLVAGIVIARWFLPAPSIAPVRG